MTHATSELPLDILVKLLWCVADIAWQVIPVTTWGILIILPNWRTAEISKSQMSSERWCHVSHPWGPKSSPFGVQRDQILVFEGGKILYHHCFISIKWVFICFICCWTLRKHPVWGNHYLHFWKTTFCCSCWMLNPYAQVGSISLSNEFSSVSPVFRLKKNPQYGGITISICKKPPFCCSGWMLNFYTPGGAFHLAVSFHPFHLFLGLKEMPSMRESPSPLMKDYVLSFWQDVKFLYPRGEHFTYPWVFISFTCSFGLKRNPYYKGIITSICERPCSVVLAFTTFICEMTDF